MKTAAVAWFVFALGLTVPALAQDDVLILEDGTSMVGRVVESTETSITFEYMGEDGEPKSATFAAGDLDPESFYSLRSAAVGDNAGAHLALAKFALDHEMFAQALMHAQRTRELDPAMMEKFDREKRTAILEGAAEKLLGAAKAAAKKQMWEQAAGHLDDILVFLPKTKAADEARALIVEIGNKITTERAEREAASIADESVEVVDGRPVTGILLRSGQTRRGIVLGTTDDSITFMVPTGEGRVTTVLKAHNVDPVSFFKLRRKDIGEDAAAHLKLAAFCIENELPSRAYFEYETAKALDPAMVAEFEAKELPRLLQEMADSLVKEARDDVAADRLDKAERKLAIVLTRFTDTAAAEEGRALLDQINEKYQRLHAERSAELVRSAEEAQNEAEQEALKALDPVLKTMERARSMRHRALQDKNKTRGTKELEAAARQFETAVKELDGMAKKHEGDKLLTKHIGEHRQEALQAAVGAYLDAGDLLLSNSAYTPALKCADKALGVDPGNSQAAAFKARVQVASAAAAGTWERGPGRRVR